MNDQPTSEHFSHCPPMDELAILLSDPQSLRPELARHVDRCSKCQTVLEQISDSGALCELRQIAENSNQRIASLGPPMRDTDLGSLGNLAIEAVIGEGGMGVVYRGRDDQVGRRVAVKILKHDDHPRSRARFNREAKALAKLNHDHVVPLYSVGWASDERPYLVMPLIEGISLKDRISQGNLDVREAVELIRQAALGLEAAHAVSLVHRDVKPANILLDLSDGRAKLSDFGLVQSTEDGTLTQANVLCGTPEYMSPEQADAPDHLDGRSDVYSLGVTLYECLTGTTPFRGRVLEVIEQHRAGNLTYPTKLNRLIPPDLETICLKAMAVERDRRYWTASAMADDLARFLDGRPISARPVSRLTHARLWSKRNPALAATLGLLIVSLTAGTVVSSAMWLRSKRHAEVAERNAQDAQNLANDLQASRDRLEDSVRRFQSRIFSEEAMHWEMSQDFRKEMFRDVLEYLDEFARYERTDSGNHPAKSDRLAQDYLKVAEAAFQVGQHEEATLAARRAWSRLQDVMGTSNHAVVEDWVTRNKTARLLLDMSANRKSGFDKDPISEWVADAVHSAERVTELRPDDPLSQLIQIQTSWQRARNTSHHSDESSATELENLFQDLAGFKKKITSEGFEPAAFASLFSAIGWELASLSKEDESNRWFDEVTAKMHWCREGLRHRKLPMPLTDRLMAENELRRAMRARKRGDHQAAFAALEIADQHYHEAVDLSPQNRIWRRDLAEFQAWYGEYLIADDPSKEEGVKRLKTVLTHYVKLLETDAADHELRIRAIEHFVRFGEVVQSQGDFALAWKAYWTAAQDCMLLEDASDEIITWSIQTRIWAYQRALEASKPASLAEQQAEMEKYFSHWLKRLERSHPAHFEFAQKLLASETPIVLPEPLFDRESAPW